MKIIKVTVHIRYDAGIVTPQTRRNGRIYTRSPGLPGVIGKITIGTIGSRYNLANVRWIDTDTGFSTSRWGDEDVGELGREGQWQQARGNSEQKRFHKANL